MRIVYSVPHLAAAVAFITVCSLAQCAAARGEEPGSQNGIASWYGKGHAGRRTANGEIHDSGMATAAHLRLPFGSRVKVVNRKTGASVVVRINDRGPFAKGRIIDLSERAARDLGLLTDGIGPVSISLIKPQERTWRIASR